MSVTMTNQNYVRRALQSFNGSQPAPHRSFVFYFLDQHLYCLSWLGRECFNRHHLDYCQMQMLCHEVLPLLFYLEQAEVYLALVPVSGSFCWLFHQENCFAFHNYDAHLKIAAYVYAEMEIYSNPASRPQRLVHLSSVISITPAVMEDLIADLSSAAYLNHY